MKSRRESIVRFWTGLATIGCLAFASAAHAQSGPPGAPGAAGPVEVGVVTMHAQSVPFTVALTGRVTASQEAEVRPQVGGVIKAINFREGSQVKAGDVLYEIDDASYKASVAVAQASVEKANAAVSSAQAKYDRYVKLGSNVSASDLEDARIALVQAQADVASAKASLDAAQINLDLTKVTAPISGLISRSAVTQGALVTAAQTTALATVRLLDPIFVDLVDTSVNLLRIRSQVESGALQGGGRGQPPTVHLTLEDGSAYGEAGRMTLTDVVVSESTGTFSLRATFPNPHRILLPGMFVRAQVDLGNNPKAFLVPQRAVTFNAAGDATALVATDGKAVSRVLTTDGSVANAWIVTAGIGEGDQVIVDGLQKIAAGSAVKPVEVTLDDNGVVHQTIGAAPAAAASQ
jgi:membrane fusion protein (multidrug efflux system)